MVPHWSFGVGQSHTLLLGHSSLGAAGVGEAGRTQDLKVSILKLLPALITLECEQKQLLCC